MYTILLIYVSYTLNSFITIETICYYLKLLGFNLKYITFVILILNNWYIIAVSHLANSTK